ncbi:sensor histidine kinase [Pseudooceanicola spongiae]|uniref:histidine kinase n=1 Tax=Pseudooceanicola spongiae TaxID=2613965 RepID=A0A7L9WS38_9RHOB|nr:ATP-binding protein [Pseudooceanicola spongiae]QOL82692.1 PAS domain S-box protein [Pseudooceanicola spongiae]
MTGPTRDLHRADEAPGRSTSQAARHKAGAENRSPSPFATTALVAVAMSLALGIFALDVLSPLQGAVAVLYTIVVMITTRTASRRIVLATGGICALLAVAGYDIAHSDAPVGSPAVRLGVSLVSILVTSLLSASQIATAAAAERADALYATIFNAAGFPIWESDWSCAYRMLKAGVPADVALVKRAGKVAMLRNANHQAAQLFGFRSRNDLIGSNILHHQTLATQACLAQIFERLLAGESPVEAEVQLLTAVGDLVDVVLRVSLPPDDHGWQRVLVTALDVTERNRAQQRLADSRAELVHMSRVMTLGQIAASIAHEVNQPLTAIITYAKSGRRWMARKEPDYGEVTNCLDQIAANGSRAAEVIARIRDLARKSDPVQAAIDVHAVLADTVMLLQRDLNAAETRLHIALPDTLPPVHADRVQLQQVLMNLIMNAQQAMADTAPEDRNIWIEGQSDSAHIEVNISDCGSGLKGADPETLFNPFFTTKAEGMGMGLTICRSIIEQHGGTLVAGANAHGGVTMQFRLPRRS